MTGSPFAKLDHAIPVTIVTTPIAGTTADDIAVIRMEPSRHNHASGVECIACASAGDIRALLFDLLESARQGHRPAFTRVVIDASAMSDPADIIDRLTPGKLPAIGLRDHAVAKNFHLSREV